MSHLAMCVGRGIAPIILGALLLSCSSPTEATCGADAPDPGDCHIADAYGTCGAASGSPRFACDESGTCKWFTSDCPAGFIPTDCPDDNLCCHDGWPFAAPAAFVEEGGPVSRRVHAFLFGFQREPWTPERALTLDVVVDPDLVAMAEFVCEGTDPYADLYHPVRSCSDVTRQAIARLGDTLVIRPQSVESYWYARIEVEPSGDGAYTARACGFRFTDTSSPVCPFKRAVACAQTGTVRLNRIPTSEAELEGLQVDFDLVYENGFRHAGGYDVIGTFE